MEEKRQKGLNTRQHRLKDYLKEHFVSGKYFSIEEIVEGVVDSEGHRLYELNTNPRVHDKCIALSQDVKKINFNITDRYIPIVKDKFGGIKLAESKEEVEEFISLLRKKVERMCEYYNTILYKAKLDGTIPFINLAGRVLEEDEIQPVNAFERN